MELQKSNFDNFLSPRFIIIRTLDYVPKVFAYKYEEEAQVCLGGHTESHHKLSINEYSIYFHQFVERRKFPNIFFMVSGLKDERDQVYG